MSTSNSHDFLVEIGTEELPPTALLKLSNSFSASIKQSLTAADLTFTSIEPYATPRRLAVVVKDLAAQTPAKDIVAWGPPAKIAFDAEGKPAKAAEAFAKKNGINIDELKVENDGKADKLVHRSSQAGTDTKALLPEFVQNALDALPIPKRMRWGASRNEFVRPVHWVVMMLDTMVIDCEILGLKAANISRGHRFHCDTYLEFANPSVYQELLANSGHVIASYEQRKEMIREQVTAEGKKVGGNAVIVDDLLDEVTGLVEWPVALTGSFEQEFLAVPAEALISSMAEHQKYFHVVDDEGKLLPHFITVSNIVSLDPAQVIDGNERVIRPRLSDAAFFFETDKKTPLLKRVEKLKSVVFQAKLGTLHDKAQRIEKLAGILAEKIGSDASKAAKAGLLCKADLVSDMVLEFDKMQGIAGTYYALNDGEDAETANAIKDHYLPKFAGDKLPETLTGCAVALADRLDTLVGIFGIGQKPSGSKDPFALRRASLAVLRLIIEKDLNLDLRDCLALAQQQHGELPAAKGLTETVLAYMLERFRAWYVEDNIAAEVFMAVSAKNLSQPLDINQRVLAVNHFSQLPEALALAAANKRVSNILAKADVDYSSQVNESLLEAGAENLLYTQLMSVSTKVAPLIKSRSYTEALSEMAILRDPVDAYFDHVMVNVEDENLRKNRLSLLAGLRNLFLNIADISLLAPAK
ncbi:glycine--tRNA ligase subunit beta [Dasania sp. GY-MA-18]|uniref:Glycine--tRNA ligase beta subunit n=1 Tax=Dasania phycosphaerae TaxID=2950436 RepID=A0A9J6RIA7_9GAMM|nr:MULTISPECIES: glycine--tRNA ligase subunit beta [Dasania]MCR8921994.1 glycine--tRNA ligase subunit beta [Dasania sp. GY-MA-18]MCZ0864422.1 glycine--tRNA ligase subunit beta [Dasania phycosphaerae]MCZ0868150.1 glycine--tRNA ligase subunit beta [Dasania phycosphaerae]